MSYTSIVKGRGFKTFYTAYKNGRIRQGDEVFVKGLYITRGYQVFEKDESLIGIEDPVMTFSIDMKQAIGKKRWELKRK